MNLEKFYQAPALYADFTIRVFLIFFLGVDPDRGRVLLSNNSCFLLFSTQSVDDKLLDEFPIQ